MTRSIRRQSWRNGETSEVESEFELLQQEFGSSGGHGGAAAGAEAERFLAVTNVPEDRGSETKSSRGGA
jgi:hypothetical protein